MSRARDIFQTLGNRDNADEVEAHGSYLCRSARAWLGEGYYFWDSLIENAHWWGHSAYNDDYFICQALFRYEDDTIFDLVGDPLHLKELREVSYLLKSHNMDCTVAGTIEYLKRQTSFSSDYVAIKARDEFPGRVIARVFFRNDKPEFINTEPRIQFCILKRRPLPVSEYKIIYPPEYRKDSIQDILPVV